MELAAWLDALSKATESKVVAQSSVPAKSYSLQVVRVTPVVSLVWSVVSSYTCCVSCLICRLFLHMLCLLFDMSSLLTHVVSLV